MMTNSTFDATNRLRSSSVCWSIAVVLGPQGRHQVQRPLELLDALGGSELQVVDQQRDVDAVVDRGVPIRSIAGEGGAQELSLVHDLTLPSPQASGRAGGMGLRAGRLRRVRE